MKNLKLSLLAFILPLVAATSLAAAVKSGDKAPEFTLTSTDGNTHSLSEFSGKTVVLEWINHKCPFVVKHYEPGNMQKLQKTYTEKGVVWLSINSTNPNHRDYQGPEGENQLRSEYEAMPTAILLDPEGTVGKAYGAKTTPFMVVIDSEGSIVYQGAIDDKPSTNSNDIPDSVNYVAAALDSLMAGESIAVTDTRSYGCSVKY